jgi:hypothetical protein
MAGANSSIQITDLDFNTIKSNFTNYLRGQDTFKDYNFEGSGMNILMDVLAYNTQYNAYYLNMVANELFLDSSVQRSSVVSHAKLLGYTPKSTQAPSATVQVVFTGVTDTSLTLPAYSSFLSSSIDGVNYTFVNTDSYTNNRVNNTVTFNNVEIKQGVLATQSYVVDSSTNPSFTFEISDENVDTSTLKVLVQKSSSNSAYEIYNLATNFLTINSDSKVYFLQESLKETYEIYFGDGALGKKLSDGNIVNITYLSTEGTSAAKANSFVLMDSVSGYSASAVNSISEATSGTVKETIDSIKFQAPKSYASQNRAVSKNDYITAIQQNSLGIPLDAVSVWGGEENDPPVYGQVFISMKPAGAYSLTPTQKQRIISEVVSPISVLTVTPTIIDPDYTYIKLVVNVVYDSTKTTQTSAQIETGVKSAIIQFAKNTLNTFNSTLNSYELLNAIQSYNNSIITSEFSIELQKKIYPNLATPTTYKLYYGVPLQPGRFLTGVNSYPRLTYRNPINLAITFENVFIEEVPSSTNGVESASVINPGFGYQSTPTITILGDGTGATAHAVVSGGAIRNIIIDTPGTGYTSAVIQITPVSGDTTGQLGAAVINLQGRYGTLRTYYYDNKGIKTIFNSNVGTVDYLQGIITLDSFNPLNVEDPLGQLTISATPTTNIISSTYQRILTLDEFDVNSITVNVTTKTV